MHIEQIYTGCLAQGAYYIESDGESAIIDPLREIGDYIARAAVRNAKIKYVLETHFHADFVSGHVDLAEKTGAEIVFGPTAKTDFPITVAEDGQEFPLGKLKIRVIHTPGHTMESTSYLLLNEAGNPHALFSGDTLFIGDVGRPDLAQKATHTTVEMLAATLYRSLREKIMILPGETLIYPAHGAGSACGKNMSDRTWDTLANQLKTNYALRADMTENEFVAELTAGLLPPPQYFPKNVALNKSAVTSVDELLATGLNDLSPDAFEAATSGALILDTRHQDDFAQQHIPGSIFIGIDDGFAPWVGALIKDLKQPILIVADTGREKEVVTRLARVGYEGAKGFLAGGLESWTDSGRETDSVKQVSAEGLSKLLANDANGEIHVLDVRKPAEFQAEHLDGAQSLPLDFVSEKMDVLETGTTYHVHCLAGYRSMIFTSILKARGFHDVVNILGGFEALEKTSIPTTDFVCPTLLL